MSHLDEIPATERDYADLAWALSRYRQMFDGEPSNLAQIHLARTQAEVCRYVEQLLEVQALAFTAWVENNREPLPDDLGKMAAEWSEARKNAGQ
jgi:hypothetical protein